MTVATAATARIGVSGDDYLPVLCYTGFWTSDFRGRHVEDA